MLQVKRNQSTRFGVRQCWRPDGLPSADVFSGKQNSRQRRRPGVGPTSASRGPSGSHPRGGIRFGTVLRASLLLPKDSEDSRPVLRPDAETREASSRRGIGRDGPLSSDRRLPWTPKRRHRRRISALWVMTEAFEVRLADLGPPTRRLCNLAGPASSGRMERPSEQRRCCIFSPSIHPL